MFPLTIKNGLDAEKCCVLWQSPDFPKSDCGFVSFYGKRLLEVSYDCIIWHERLDMFGTSRTDRVNTGVNVLIINNQHSMVRRRIYCCSSTWYQNSLQSVVQRICHRQQKCGTVLCKKNERYRHYKASELNNACRYGDECGLRDRFEDHCGQSCLILESDMTYREMSKGFRAGKQRLRRQFCIPLIPSR